MTTFSDFITEGQIPTVGMVKKLIKSLSFTNILPEFFSVEKKNTDAGMGGYNYIQITYDAKEGASSKRYSDVKLALMELDTKWGADTSKQGVIIIK